MIENKIDVEKETVQAMRAIIREAKRLAWERGFRSGWDADGMSDLDTELKANPYGTGESVSP